MSNYKVSITGIDTSRLVVLTASEMKELFIKKNNGDKQAKELLINGNLKLVLSILKRFNNDRYNMDDLFQVGVIGLIKAIDNFDLSYNLKLSTYAVPLILGEVKRYIRDNTALRVSRGVKDLAYSIIKYKEEYLSRYGYEPTNENIANEFMIPEYKILEVMDALKEPLSIYEPIYNDGGDTIYLGDQIADNKEHKKDYDMLISLRKALDKIKARERLVLSSRYEQGKTQVEIAASLGISQAQVSRIEKGAIKQLKKVLK